jgi:transcriptional regulator GlxA family with amidase domain
MMNKRFPTVQIDRDAIFVQQGPVWTSAGVTAGIDLALALVGQSQFSELLRAQADATAAFDELNLWIVGHLDSADLTVECLAEQACMSPRNFARVYKQTTGRTPARAVEVFRLEAARRLLEDSTLKVDQIARHCGFGDEERMRVTFQRNLGVAPRDYRERFAKRALHEAITW